MKTKKFQAELLSGHQENAVEVPFDPTATWGMRAETTTPAANADEKTLKLTATSGILTALIPSRTQITATALIFHPR